MGMMVKSFKLEGDHGLVNRQRTTMRILKLFLVFAIACVFAAPAGGQNLEIVQGWVSTATQLAGHVDVGFDRNPAEGVAVELCSPGWKAVLDSTKTDRTGYFSLETPKTNALLYLRLSAPGMDTYKLRVRIGQQGTDELSIHLNNAT